MTEQPPGPPPGSFPPPPPGGGYPPPQGGGFSPPQGGGYPPPQGGGFSQPPQGGGYPPPFSGGPGYPPPGPGGYPPPPPGAGGYGPPPPGNAIGQLPQQAYTSWITRVLAALIDFVPILLLEGIGVGIMFATISNGGCVTDTSEYGYSTVCSGEPSALGSAAQLIAGLLVFAYAIWNFGYRQGTTGSSVGKSVLKFKVVSERTGAPIGFGMSIVRQLAHVVDTLICYIGYLFPLWDAKRQTLADKIMSTVCLPTQP